MKNSAQAVAIKTDSLRGVFARMNTMVGLTQRICIILLIAGLVAFIAWGEVGQDRQTRTLDDRR